MLSLRIILGHPTFSHLVFLSEGKRVHRDSHQRRELTDGSTQNGSPAHRTRPVSSVRTKTLLEDDRQDTDVDTPENFSKVIPIETQEDTRWRSNTTISL